MEAPRSLLYVPASRPRLLGKLPQLAPDAVVLDLEDGVSPADKEAARAAVRRLVADGGLAGARWMLRVNDAPGLYDADLELAAELQAPAVVLPKAESLERVTHLAAAAAGWGARVALMIETAAGVGRAAKLASASRAVALILGSADLRLSLGARPDDARCWERTAMGQVLLAARECGSHAIDSVFFRFKDREGLRRHGRIARDMGYDGKSCIHPGQIDVIHEVWAAEAGEVAWAHRVIDAWENGGGAARGVIALDGEMIEALHVELARRILRRR